MLEPSTNHRSMTDEYYAQITAHPAMSSLLNNLQDHATTWRSSVAAPPLDLPSRRQRGN